MKKIKVLHLLATNKYSGAESVVCDIIENASKSIEYIYCSIDGPIREVLKNKNITFIPIKKLNLSNIKKVILSVKPDIIHAHDFRASFIVSLCKGKIKFISHIHNNAPWLKKICFNSFIFLYSSFRANKVLIVSNSIKEEFVFRKLIMKKMICVHNPVIRDKITNMVKIDNQKKEYDICCIARITASKDPYKFLSIIKELVKFFPKIKVVWVGDGELKNEILEKSNQLELNHNIRFVGFQKNPYTYLMNSKVFLLTSNWEGFGLVAFEALTLGKPCVVSNVGGLKTIVDDTCGKLCNPNSINDYINEIKLLLSEKTYYDNKAKMAIKKSFILDNKNSYFKKLEQIYRDELKK